MSDYMQTLLNVSEFSYLLHTLNAKQVVGVHNEAIFPADEKVRDALLAEGFEALQQDGWLVPEGKHFHTNVELMLLVAVVAAPETTVMLTRRVETGTRQTITYYQAQGIFVEQVYTSEKRYLLTRLNALDDVVERLILAMDVPQQAKQVTAVSLSVDSFEKAMAQAQSDNMSTLTALLSANELTERDAELVASQIGKLQAVGNIEIASFSGEQLRQVNQIIILKHETNMWVMLPTDTPETVRLQTIETASFSRMMQTILNRDGGK